jgi:thymidylate synthase (FAD)
MTDSQIRVQLQDHMGSDRSIAEAAWTSSTTLVGKAKRTDEDVERLVRRLADDRHSTPFESVVLRFWIKMPITSDRQHVTHRIASHNGMSGRYRTMPREWLAVPDDIKAMGFENISSQYDELCKAANDFYEGTLQILKTAEGLGNLTNDQFKRMREFYRGVLPQNNMTERVTVINLRSWANFQKQRNSPKAQDEIRLVARLMYEEVVKANVCPVALESLEKNGWNI